MRPKTEDSGPLKLNTKFISCLPITVYHSDSKPRPWTISLSENEEGRNDFHKDGCRQKPALTHIMKHDILNEVAQWRMP